MTSCCVKFVVANFSHASIEISNINECFCKVCIIGMEWRGTGINWSCMHTEYSWKRIEVISCVSIWMDYAVATSPVSCVESFKKFQLLLVAEKACMVYARKYWCTGAVIGLHFKLLTWNQNKHKKSLVEKKCTECLLEIHV